MTGCGPAHPETVTLNWLTLPDLPPAPGESIQPGLAGPVAGVAGNCLLVAGGANFPDGPPWRGGAKQYHDDVYLLEESGDGLFKWKTLPERLPGELAYPACLSLPAGILCIGGENRSGPVASVNLFSLSDGRLVAKAFPELPEALSACGAAIIGLKIYVAGGMGPNGAVASFYCLDMQDTAAGWKPLAPLPVALSHAVVVSADDTAGPGVYVIGGRNKTGELSTFLGSVWKYDTVNDKWLKDSEIAEDPKPIALSAGTGSATGRHTILLFGGDRGMLFNRTEEMNAAIAKADEPAKGELLNRKDSMLTSHPGFRREILQYNTLTHEWKAAGLLPAAGPVTTVALWWKNRIVIPSGEVKPGVRTPGMLAAEVIISK
jgi:cyclically-permuted mutarotase family protein